MPSAIRPVLVIDYTMTGTTTQNVDYTATRPFAICDSHNFCLTADATSTTNLERQALGAGAFTAVHTAIACAVAGAVTRVTAGVANAQYVFAATDVCRCVFTAANSTLVGRHFASIAITAVTGA